MSDPQSAVGRVVRRVGAWGAAGLTLLLTAVTFLPLRHAGYIQDDHLAVERNEIVERGDLGEIFGSYYWAGARGADKSLYRPVAIWSYALERRAVGAPDAAVAHGVNLLLHAGVSMLLMLLALRLGAGLSAAAAAMLLFAVHPVHVEAVGSIVARAEILAAGFSLLALWALTHTGPWRGRSASPGRRRLAAWGAAAALFLALGSKEVALVTPMLMLLLELLFRAPVGRVRDWLLDRAAALAPSALAVELYLVLRLDALEGFPLQQPHPLDNHLVLLDGIERLATALGLVVRTLWLLAFPVRLSIDYSGYVIPVEPGLLAWRPLLGLAILAGATGLLLGSWIRRSPVRLSPPPRDPGASWPVVSLSAGLFLLPYLIVGNLLNDVGTIFAERLLYFPSTGFCLLFGVLLSRLAWTYPAFPNWSEVQRVRLIGVALVILLGAFCLQSWGRALAWRDDATVFGAAARSHPLSPRAHFIIGKSQLEAGRDEAALAAFERALELWPSHIAALIERGTILGRRGRFAEAEASFAEALAHAPGNPLALLNLGIALHRQGRLADAERALRKATLTRSGPDGEPVDPSAKVWAQLGHVRFDAARWGPAAAAYRRAVDLGRDDLRPRLREAETRAGRG